MKTLAVITGASLLLVSACSDDEVDLTASTQAPEGSAPSDPNELIQRSLAAMDALTSYRMEITFRPEGQPITTTAEYADPGDYHYLFRGFEASDSVTELIEAGDSSYVRSCDDYPNDCGNWERSDRFGVSSLGGFTTTTPETLPFVALELAVDFQIVEAPRNDGSSVHLRGAFNLPRSIYENQRRAVVAAGIEDTYGESCSTSDSFGTDQTPVSTCRPVSFEQEYAEARAEYGDNFEKAPVGPLDVWIHLDSSRIDSVFLGVPGSAEATEQTYLEVHYSEFDGITIAAPEHATEVD